MSKTDFTGPIISEYHGPVITEINGPKFRIIFGGRWAKFSSGQACSLRLENGGYWANNDFDFGSHWANSFE
ncbi:hypothetical protein DYBT9275_02627 [Dyadobacter sp. CECT 9275]|uniref:Uncharacterized protein n=1 Tax=Dyadobacter helix TaxID=2822344 RepID=A0A916N626_9BACT|nr:hypothetical protein [Dyadobacter sp. CECT 9275]CAG5001247.1 hypothetical protein DYBT9275_02627 [Dyadobacter sp. CECT 9275]